MKIEFYRVSDPYGFLSNFSPHRIFLGNLMWFTSEHYFQARKFSEIEIVDKIRSTESPLEAARLGRSRDYPLLDNWEVIKDGVMLKALTAKFLQHPSLRKSLLDTGDADLIEHTINDSYWGDGGDGSGRNRLGELLMALREDLRSMCSDPEIILPPWIAFSHIEQEDMFWRMGFGENYLNKWAAFYHALGTLSKNTYDRDFPTPNSWEDWGID